MFKDRCLFVLCGYACLGVWFVLLGMLVIACLLTVLFSFRLFYTCFIVICSCVLVFWVWLGGYLFIWFAGVVCGFGCLCLLLWLRLRLY